MSKKWQECGEVYFDKVEENFAWYAGAPLRGLTLKAVEGGWLLVIRTASVRRGALVAFFGGATPGDCFEAMHQAVNTTGGINWKEDKYA